MSLWATDVLDWNDGRLVRLSAGQTARCASLVRRQLYAILLYNTTQADMDAVVTVVWSNEVPPQSVTVRGTTAEAAPANFVFVSGTDTNFVSISLGPRSGATVVAFVVSILMPLNTEGLHSAELPSDGQFHSYGKYDRYYAVSATGWRRVTIESPREQFISVRMHESTAMVIVLNVGAGPTRGQICKVGPTAAASGTVEIKQVTYQSYQEDIKGNGGTWVWMNGDSQQNSASVTIALQELSAIQVFLKVSGLSRLSKNVRRAVGL